MPVLVPRAAIILASATDRELWQGPKQESANHGLPNNVSSNNVNVNVNSKFPIMSVPKVTVTLQFYLYKLMPSVVFLQVTPRTQRNGLIIVYLCANQIIFKSINCNGKKVSFSYICASKGWNK